MDIAKTNKPQNERMHIMRATIDFQCHIPQRNHELYLRVIDDMTESFSRYYHEEFIDMVCGKIWQYTAEWLAGDTFEGWDTIPRRVWDVAFDEAMDEYDALLADRAAEAAEAGE